MSVIINDSDFQCPNDGFFFFDVSVGCTSESVNGNLDMEFDFKFQTGKFIITVILKFKDLSLIESSKSGEFSFHSCFKVSNSGSKVSLSIFFSLSDFDDGFVLNI